MFPCTACAYQTIGVGPAQAPGILSCRVWAEMATTLLTCQRTRTHTLLAQPVLAVADTTPSPDVRPVCFNVSARACLGTFGLNCMNVVHMCACVCVHFPKGQTENCFCTKNRQTLCSLRARTRVKSSFLLTLQTFKCALRTSSRAGCARHFCWHCEEP